MRVSGRTIIEVMEHPSIDVDRLSEEWQHAFDAAHDALDASERAFVPVELARRRKALGGELRSTAALLDDVARTDHLHQHPWLSPVRIGPRMLGLDSDVRACIFDLDGVLTDSGLAHAAAWSAVLDSVLLHHADEAGHEYLGFDPDVDYRAFFDGKQRLEGIHAFLASRGIRLDTSAVQGLAGRKAEALERVLSRRGITALEGARRYLEAVGHAGLPRGVVSCSQRTEEMLALAGLTSLVEATIDAGAIESLGLNSRPAPDVLEAVCTELDVEPSSAVTFTHTPEGIAAGMAAGMRVFGIGNEVVGARLTGFGAERVAPSLFSLLDARLRQG